MRVLAAAILILASGLCRAAAAEPDSPAGSWGMQQLMQGMAEVKSSRRKFTERKYLHILTVPLEFSGILVYEAPGHLEKHTLVPSDESMVLNQGVIAIENKSRHVKRTIMANQYPAVGAFVEAIRATLAGDLNTLTHYYQVKLDGTAAHWRLQLVPNDSAARNVVREVRLEGRGKAVASIEILDAGGDRSVLSVGEEIAAGDEASSGDTSPGAHATGSGGRQ